MSIPGLERVQLVSMSPASTGGVLLRARTSEGVRVILRIEALCRIADPLLAFGTYPYAMTRLIDHLERITFHEVSGAGISQLLDDRELLSTRLRVALGAQALNWGVEVLDVEITAAEAELDRELLRRVR